MVAVTTHPYAPVALKKSSNGINIIKKEGSEAELAETFASKTIAKSDRALAIVQEKAFKLKGQTLILVKSPHFKTVTISAAGGTITFGSVGGAFGLASGVVVGGAAGVLPAIFTFGLSLPIGATIGGGCGACAGTLIGASTGAVGGAAAGHSVYKYRVEIYSGYIKVKTKACDLVSSTRQGALATKEATKKKVIETYTVAKDQTISTVTSIKTKSGKAYSDTNHFLATTNYKVIAAGGAVVGGTVGGAGGMLTGGALGAAGGVPLALFTFGLSIPIGVVIGGAVGLATGTVAGGSAGALGGGVVGLYSQGYR